MANVKLILVESIHRLGEAGDLVSVKPGFARNFLLPQGKAMLATESRVKEFEHKRRIAEEKAAKEQKDLEAVKQRLEALKIEIGARAGESGKLFGSVTAAQIADKVEAAGHQDRSPPHRSARADQGSRRAQGRGEIAARAGRAALGHRRRRGWTFPRGGDPGGRGRRSRGRRRRRDDETTKTTKKSAGRARILLRASSAGSKMVIRSHRRGCGGAVVEEASRAGSDGSDGSESRAPSIGRIPPHDLEAEKAVLSALLLDNLAIHSVLNEIEPEDFYHPSHQLIYQAMLDLQDENEPVDLLTLSDHLNTAKKLDRVGGLVFLAELADYEATAANVLHHAKIVRDKAVKRQPDPRVERDHRGVLRADRARRSAARLRRVEDLRARPGGGAHHASRRSTAGSTTRSTTSRS